MPQEQRSLNSDRIRKSLESAGMSQKDLAAKMDVTAQAVTNWLSGKDFPRPPKLLKLAMLLNLPADQLVMSDVSSAPIVAFRRKGGSKTTQAHIERARHIGMLLRPLVGYFADRRLIRPSFRSSSVDSDAITQAALQTRARLGLSEKANIKYSDLIDEFRCCGAALVPVMWGKKETHKNALHIHLPEENFTFIFLNLDTRMEDFKFWMAHELAHVYTPDLAGTDEGEDFADAFAGSLLFSPAMAAQAYKKIVKHELEQAQLNELVSLAEKQRISALTVYKQTMLYARRNELPRLKMTEKVVNMARSVKSSGLVSESLFGAGGPAAKKYLKVCVEKFSAEFFEAYRKMSEERDVGSGYLQQVLSITRAEAKELHQVLIDDDSRTS